MKDKPTIIIFLTIILICFLLSLCFSLISIALYLSNGDEDSSIVNNQINESDNNQGNSEGSSLPPTTRPTVTDEETSVPTSTPSLNPSSSDTPVGAIYDTPTSDGGFGGIDTFDGNPQSFEPNQRSIQLYESGRLSMIDFPLDQPTIANINSNRNLRWVEHRSDNYVLNISRAINLDKPDTYCDLYVTEGLGQDYFGTVLSTEVNNEIEGEYSNVVNFTKNGNNLTSVLLCQTDNESAWGLEIFTTTPNYSDAGFDDIFVDVLNSFDFE